MYKKNAIYVSVSYDCLSFFLFKKKYYPSKIVD